MRIRTDAIPSKNETRSEELQYRVFTCDNRGVRYLVLVNDDKTQAVGINDKGRVDTWTFPAIFENVRYDVVCEP